MNRRNLFGGLAGAIAGTAATVKADDGKDMVVVPADTLRKIDEIHAALCRPTYTPEVVLVNQQGQEILSYGESLLQYVTLDSRLAEPIDWGVQPNKVWRAK